MLDNNGFNLWANDYDKQVNVSEENNEYPFKKELFNKNARIGIYFFDC